MMLHYSSKYKLSLLVLLFSLCFGHAMLAQNILSGNYSKDDLETHLIMDKSWINYPDYTDRSGWEKVPVELRSAYIKKGKEFLDFDWTQVRATEYLEFVRSGNRRAMELPFSKNRKALQALIMAELMEGEGRFIDDMVNGIWSFCEMTYWGLSAHLYAQKAGQGLPDAEEPIIDIISGQIGVELALANHFFGKEFDNISPLINKRIIQEINEKILQPYYSRDNFWWMGFTNPFVNNWNVWCNYNVLLTILLIEQDPITKRENVFKTLRSVDHFINHYPEDGGCDEGPHYWGLAGGKLFDFLEVMNKATMGHVNIYGNEKVRNMGRYIYRAFINDRYFINFADASNKVNTRAGEVYRFGSRIEDETMMAFGSFLANQQGLGTKIIEGKIELALENLFNIPSVSSYPAKQPLIGSFWLPETQVAAAREVPNKTQGFYFAAKGGHNAESHNHNDVGTFILYYDGKPALVDAGVGTYTAKTFNSHRYEIWTMQSQYHNVPLINGQGQKEGREFKSDKVSFVDKPGRQIFKVDIADAYPKDARVKEWIRTYDLKKNKGFTISNSYELTEIKEKNVQHLLTPCDVDEIDKGTLLLKGDGFELSLKYDTSIFSLELEKLNIEDDRLKNAWPYGLTRIKLAYKNIKTKGQDTIKINRI